MSLLFNQTCLNTYIYIYIYIYMCACVRVCTVMYTSLQIHYKRKIPPNIYKKWIIPNRIYFVLCFSENDKTFGLEKNYLLIK